MFNRLRAFPQTTTVLGLAMIILIWCGVVFLSGAERDHAREAGLDKGNRLTRIFEAYISQVVKGTDSALLALRDSYERNSPDFDLMRSVDNARFQNDLVVQFVIIGREGIMKSSTLADAASLAWLHCVPRDRFRKR